MSNPNRRRPVPMGDTAEQPPAASAEAATVSVNSAPAPLAGDATVAGEAATPAPAAAASAEQPPAAPPVADGEQVEARALIDFEGYEANDVVIAAADDIERWRNAGLVDPHPDAVAYAKSLIG